MKIKRLYALILLLLLVTVSGAHPAQPISIENHDRIGLFTDRNLYISGEMIFFSALVFDPETGAPSESKVLYCELVTPEGLEIEDGKYELDRGRGYGCIEIPKEAVSGYYYLRAYTKLMRNEGPSVYHYTVLAIINPVKAEVLPSSDEDTVYSAATRPWYPDTGDRAVIITDKGQYSSREKVVVTLDEAFINENSLAFSCVSIAPEYSIRNYPPIPVLENKSTDFGKLYQETEGITLTGMLQDKISGKVLSSLMVNLSILGEKDFMAIRTDSSGRFFFNLPDIYGNRDVFLCSEKSPGVMPVVQVDNDFSPERLALPAPPFRLTSEEKHTALTMVHNDMVASFFDKADTAEDEEPAKEKLPFYGKPTEELVLDNYIDLPTIEEYFNELPTEVKVRKSQNKKFFRFSSNKAEMVIYDPLVLIDFVAVDDIDKILAVSPRDISRIELVNAPYIKGMMKYGGIISFISKNDDFAGIDLPASGTFINYKCFDQCTLLTSSEETPKDKPDTRNTAFWDPRISAGPGGKTVLNFYAPDTRGNYVVLWRGMDLQGKVFTAIGKIEIK